MEYHWPGNLRELGNFIKRFIVLRDESLAISELQAKGRNASGEGTPSTFASVPDSGLKSMVRNSRDEIELKAIEEALAATHWNRKLAAARLRISYKALLNKVKQHHLAPPAGN
jgi:DNA-binding NtrC family response regulator